MFKYLPSVAHSTIFCVSLFFFLISSASALQFSLPDYLAPPVLSETNPFVFVHNNFVAKDYDVSWIGNSIPGVNFYLGAGSLEWVRVANFHIARALLIIEATNIESGKIDNVKFFQPIRVNKKNFGRAELPIALISGPENAIGITIVRNGKIINGKLQVRLNPKNKIQEPLIYVDSTCSSYGVTTESIGARPDEWTYITCRFVRAQGEQYPVPTLEMYVFWDNVGQNISIEGIPTQSTIPSVWALRLHPDPGKITLRAGNHKLGIKYFIPKQLHNASLGVGFGPYAHTFDGLIDSEHAESIVPLLTVYGSYYVSEAWRMVLFDATAFHKRFYTDFGIYFLSNYVTVLDDRLLVNLLLGGHVLGYKTNGTTYLTPGAPQGTEIVFKDFLKKQHNLSAGIFYFPPPKTYYNGWLRWGSGSLFFEFNFLSWQIPFGDEKTFTQRVYARSVGFSVGFPLCVFF